jgi:hypothetical protein
MRCQGPMLPEQQVLVTQRGVIMAGFGRWRMAVSQRVLTMECREYTLTDEDALQFMLSLQSKHKCWNPFIRICLALKLEGTLQQRAMINMQLGGKHKGSAMLPKAAQIDVREHIAAIAGAGCRNVSKVKEILEKAHPRILGELANGSISINRAHELCRLPSSKQLEALTEEYCDAVSSDIERDLLWQGRKSVRGKHSCNKDLAASGRTPARLAFNKVQPAQAIRHPGRSGSSIAPA